VLLTDVGELPPNPDQGTADAATPPGDPGFQDRPEPSELPGDLPTPDVPGDVGPLDPGDSWAPTDEAPSDVSDLSVPDEGPADQGPEDAPGRDAEDPGAEDLDPGTSEDACVHCPDAGVEVCAPCGPWDVLIPDLPIPLCESDEECQDGNPCTFDHCDPSKGCLHLVHEDAPCVLSCGTPGLCAANGTCVGQELCNGIDDDCDGSTDEDLGTTTCGIGACRVTVQNCLNGVRQSCLPGSPAEEACNGLDDDCDGSTDEDLGTTTCGIGACRVTVADCQDGRPQACIPAPGSTEACNGIDDDCDGFIDEDLGTTTCGIGPCEVTVDNCREGRPQACIPASGSPETCNGIDDDCNGLTDEDLGTTTCGIGACQITVQNCLNGVRQSCLPGSPSGEACNGIDDDCDGFTDEDLGTTTCGIGPCEVTVDNCRDGRPQACIPAPGSTEACNGIDDDCNGLTDEVWPQLGGRCVAGIGQCRREGILVCRPDGTGLQCSEAPGEPWPEVCNLLDDDCDGDTDEDGARICDDGVPCTEDACDRGTCIHPLQASSCRIDGVCLPADGRHPIDPCLSCQPAVSQATWSPRVGAPCDDGDSCTGSDACDPIGRCTGTPWNCTQPNPLCGGDGCYCDANARTRCMDDGIPCTDEVCQNGTCTHPIRSGWCLIGGACIPDGALHPTDGCLWCQEGVQKTAWTPRNGLSCDDGDPCTAGETCDGAGACRPSASWSCAQPNPNCGGDGCYCNPTARTRCGDDGLDCTDEACEGGQCTYPVKEGRCLIGGNCLFDGNVNPNNACLSCQSATNRLAWSPRTGVACNDGNACTRNDLCSSQGQCVGTTMTCSQPNPNCGGDDCYCNPTTRKKCVDDGLACTIESCNASQVCTFTVLSGQCAIDGRCWRAGDYNPYDYCYYCNPSFSQTAWYYDWSCNN